MEDKLIKIMPPFSHIKVLEDGNYGCTLLVADKIYNGKFTQNWDCIEKLHPVAEDLYDEYDYKNADVLIPMLDEEEEDISSIENKVEYAESIYLNFEDDEDIDNNKKIGPPALFCMQYNAGEIICQA